MGLLNTGVNSMGRKMIYLDDAINAVKAGAFSAATLFGRTNEGMTALAETVRLIKDLPSAQPEPRWIPCRYHLPSLRDEIYLVSLAWGGLGTMEFKDTGWHNYGSLSPVPVETVTAWMPLPEAYKEGE